MMYYIKYVVLRDYEKVIVYNDGSLKNPHDMAMVPKIIQGSIHNRRLTKNGPYVQHRPIESRPKHNIFSDVGGGVSSESETQNFR